MKNLVKAELFKLKKLTAYKVLLVTYLVIEAAIQMNNISNSVLYPEYNPTYTGVEWLSNLHQTLLLYSMVIFLFTAFYVKGDLIACTFHGGLLCGVSRKNAFWAKVISLFAGLIPLLFISVLTGTVLWSVHAGFGIGFGTEAILIIAKAFARQILVSLMLVSHAVFFAVIARSKTGAFIWSFGALYVLGVLRGNIENIIPVPVLSRGVLFLLSVFYLNLGTFLASILLKMLAAGYIFERSDL